MKSQKLNNLSLNDPKNEFIKMKMSLSSLWKYYMSFEDRFEILSNSKSVIN